MGRKATDLIDLPIINLTSGSLMATVKNVVLDAENDILLGFICEDDKFLPLKKIKTIGEDAIVVETNDIEKILEKIKIPVSAPLFVPEHIIGTPIITKKGKSIGNIGDIILKEDIGKIESYEVSDGLLKDLVSGRSIVPILQVITYGEDAIMINE